MISILSSYNNDGYLESHLWLFQLLNVLISKNFKRYALSTFEQAKTTDELLKITGTTFRLMFPMLLNVSNT